jgi:hypothetical protein
MKTVPVLMPIPRGTQGPSGELAFSERTRAAIGPGRADFLATLGAEERDVELKGKSAPVKLHVWTAAA